MAQSPNTANISADITGSLHQIRTVMLAAPSHQGQVSVWHAVALAETCKLGQQQNINVMPIYMSYDSLVQRARNDLAQLALTLDVDDLFFIDCDQDWNPADFFRMLNHDVDIVAAPVVKKQDQEQYNVKIQTQNLCVEDQGLIRVIAAGTGFMRIRRAALQQLWDASAPYQEPNRPEPSRMLFEVKVIDGALCSEDVIMCQKWADLGGKIWIDPLVNCGHTGDKRWVGNFTQFMKQIG